MHILEQDEELDADDSGGSIFFASSRTIIMYYRSFLPRVLITSVSRAGCSTDADFEEEQVCSAVASFKMLFKE